MIRFINPKLNKNQIDFNPNIFGQRLLIRIELRLFTFYIIFYKKKLNNYYLTKYNIKNIL